MMTTEQALLAAVWASPHDDLPRLVYADWLDEHGQPERAEFIRTQIELARVGWWDDRTQELMEGEQHLLNEWRGKWTPRPKLKHAGLCFHRGLLCASLNGELRAFRGDIPLARAVAPLYDLSLQRPDGFEAFVTSPIAVGLRSLELSQQFVGWGKLLVGSPVVRNLSRLRVKDPHIPPDDFGRFCRAAHLAHLSELSLSELETTDEVIDKLLAARFAPQLRDLALGAASEFASDGFVRLLASDALTRLERLRLRIDPFCVDSSRYEWDGFLLTLSKLSAGHGLRCLHVNGGSVSEGGCLAILDWPGSATLRELEFSPSRFVPAPQVSGVRVESLIALLESDRLPRLKKLVAVPVNYDRRVSEDPGGRLAKLRQVSHDRGVKLDLW